MKKEEIDIEKLELIGKVDESQITMWRKLYGAVHIIAANGKVCYLKPADRKTVSAAAAMADRDDPVDLNEMLLRNCWLGGCEDFLSKDGDYDFLSIMSEISVVLQYGEAVIKKL